MRRYRAVAVALLVAQSGCYTVRVVDAPASELAGSHPTSLFVTRTNGQQLVVASGRVLDDTIFGFDKGGQQYALALQDTKIVRIRELNMGRTLMFGAGIVATVFGLGIVLKGKGAAPENISTDCDKHPDVTECMPK
jgi:hypothetical protein